MASQTRQRQRAEMQVGALREVINEESSLILDDFQSDYMDSWQTLERAIPKGASKMVAAQMRVAHNYVLAWRREPLSHEAPLATGMASPLSRLCDLMNAVMIVNPQELPLIPAHVKLHYQLLTRAHSINGFAGSSRERAIASAEILVKAIEAANTLTLNEVADDTLRHLVLLRSAVDGAISRVGKDLKS